MLLEEEVGATAVPSPSRHETPRAAALPASTPTASSARVRPHGSSIPLSRVPVVPSPPSFPDEMVIIQLDKINLMLRDFRTLTGGNPVGTNAEIMAAFMGENPRQAKLAHEEGLPLNPAGEVLDRWGTPYVFHQLSRDQMEIRSAGPDKVM